MIRIVTPSLAIGPPGASNGLFQAASTSREAYVIIQNGGRALVHDEDCAQTVMKMLGLSDSAHAVDNALQADPHESVF